MIISMSAYEAAFIAYQNAALAPASGPVFDQGQIEALAAYAAAPDDEILDLSFELADAPNVASADASERTIEDFAALSIAVGFSDEEMSAVVPHELAHWRMANQLGLHVGQFGVRFAIKQINGEEHDVNQFFLHLPTRVTTKLGHAILYAAPDKPSEGDEAAYKALGYRDVDDIAERAQLLNERGVLLGNGQPYPIVRTKS